ncbi:MAG: histidine triad nucleotide-binding protein [Gammaproteobacteria bacterium]|jgi:histidine triad (HIT) family protein
MNQDCLFCKIAKGEIPANIIYQDDLVVAFDDIHPKAPVHKLIIPRKHIATINDLEAEDNNLIGHMTQIAKKLAKEFKVDQSGYRVLMNCNKNAGQVVFHIHMHLLGGRTLTWPPG